MSAQNWLGLALGATGAFGMWVSGNGSWKGWAVGLAVQPVWVAFFLVVGSWTALSVPLLYGSVYARNLWRWYAPQRGPTVTDQPTPRAAERIFPEDPVCGGGPRSKCRDALHTDGDSHTWRCQRANAIDRHDPETCTCLCAGCNTGAHQACKFDWRLEAAAPEPTAPDDRCTCEPCAGRGNDGHGLTHCAECCMGTGIEDADPACPNPAHRALAKRQHGPAPDDLQEQALAALAWLVRLKDGPRDDTYRAEKEQAWEAARDVLRQRGLVAE